MSDIYTTLLLDHLFTNRLDDDELEYAIEFLLEDDERLYEMIVRIDLEVYSLKRVQN